LATTNPLKVCLASSELAPLAKTGGLADVSFALSRFLHQAGHDVRVLMPHYSTLNTTGLDITPVEFLQDIPIQIGAWQGHYSIDTTPLPDSDLSIYLLRCPALYNAIEMCQRMGFAPDIFHSHDWHTALIPILLKTAYAWDELFANTRSVLTIHNIGYQGVFGAGIVADLGLGDDETQLHQEDLDAGRVNFLKTGVLHADFLTTVSPTYAREIQGSEYGMGLQDLLRARSESLAGILNGVDYAEWNPETDPLIPANYTPEDLAGKAVCKQVLMNDLQLSGDEDRPLIGIVTRLASQKGIDLVQKVLPALLGQRDFAVAVLGSGEPRYEHFFKWLEQKYRDRVCFYRGYNNKLAHWIEAGSDMFLMPSLYEPCGLNQMYSLKYGTLPIVRETGGLADSVQLVNPARKTGTGVVFRDYNEDALAWAIHTALDLYADKPVWQQVIQNGMAMDFSWKRQGQLYVDLFRALSQTS
jgi:starch synthase